MRVETPQILWHSEEDKGINAALMSVSLLQSGMDDMESKEYGNVLATAGNSNLIHLWKVTMNPTTTTAATTATAKDEQQQKMFHKASLHKAASSAAAASLCKKFEYLLSFTRHDGPVNAVQFSPNGLHLATASETGAVIVWSVPHSKRGNGNGRHFWAVAAQHEKEFHVQRVLRVGVGDGCTGITDISWSADSKRFVLGTLDHAVVVCELSTVSSSSSTATAGSGGIVKEDWKVVYHNGMDHTHYVQGVTYDPLGVYLASMSSDRTVRVYPRKASKAMKKAAPTVTPRKVLKPTDPQQQQLQQLQWQPSLEEQRAVQEVLSDAKLELGRSKEIRKCKRVQHTAEQDNDDAAAAAADTTTATDTTPNTSSSSSSSRRRRQQQQQWSFADEATLQSFVRRLSWTTDGAFLVVPAALWPATESYATLLFARHRFDEPYRVLHGLEKPSVAVRPNPVLFQLPSDAKENQSPGLPYRSLFCVLTWDTVLIYDTYHTKPLALIQGLHYANLVDATWSADGHALIVCSTDGYLSLIQFAPGELGEVYTPPQPQLVAQEASAPTNVAAAAAAPPTANTTSAPTLPPCEPGPVAVDARPAKKAKRIAPTPVVPLDGNSNNNNNNNMNSHKRPVAEEASAAVDKLTLASTCTSTNAQPTVLQPKKKKRIQPMLLAQAEQ